MVAKRFWEATLKKGATTIGFANGSFSIDAGLQTFKEFGNYDLAARREATRDITGTIEHGFIDVTLFATGVLGTSQLTTFDIHVSMAANAIIFSGCSIETYDYEVPSDGWISETVNWRAKTIKSW